MSIRQGSAIADSRGLTSRRRLLKASLASALLTFDPRLRRNGSVTLLPQAQAWVWAAIGVVLAAYSAFTRNAKKQIPRDTVPPLLLYADLIATLDPRNA